MSQHSVLKPDATIAALSYELNAAALSVAAEAERLGGCVSMVAETNSGHDIGLIGRIHFLIVQLHETALLLRYARHSGVLPLPRSIRDERDQDLISDSA